MDKKNNGNKITAAVVGANGYTGYELLKLLARHPSVEKVIAASRSNEGEKITALYPTLEPYFGGEVFRGCGDGIIKSADVAFTALPHTVGAALGGSLYDSGVKLIDLSADFRYDSLALYESTYKVSHPRADLNEKAVYGLCELNREKIRKADIVGNPGCYTTAAILALYPLIREGVILSEGIIVDGKSGITGAGRKSDTAYSFCEADENFKTYSPVGHRHTSEMTEKLGIKSLSFTPHLLPVKRGILQTIYARANTEDYARIEAAYKKYYSGEKFVGFTAEALPETKHVRGSNRCLIGAVIDKENSLIKIVSVIDNLIKGASGQAVQNMNIMLGLDETAGLPLIGEQL